MFEYGSFGSDFFFILDGEVEILLPNKSRIDDYNSTVFEIGQLKSSLLGKKKELENFLIMQENLRKKRELDKLREQNNLLFKVERRFTRVLENDIPAEMFKR